MVSSCGHLLLVVLSCCILLKDFGKLNSSPTACPPRGPRAEVGRPERCRGQAQVLDIVKLTSEPLKGRNGNQFLTNVCVHLQTHCWESESL